MRGIVVRGYPKHPYNLGAVVRIVGPSAHKDGYLRCDPLGAICLPTPIGRGMEVIRAFHRGTCVDLPREVLCLLTDDTADHGEYIKGREGNHG